MVQLIKRMRKLHELLWIRCGPGALILPKEVSKITMEFNTKLAGGHGGARRFWREMLPRIKYRNPSVPMQILRHNDPTGPSLMHIYTSTQFSPPPSTSTETPPSGTPNARTTLVPDTSAPTHTIDIRNKTDKDILEALYKQTGATRVVATEQEKEEMEEIKEFKERSEKDRVQVREYLEKERREAELMRLARGEVAAENN